ncbi:type III-B CRISPR module RAMP protein Cmr6 [Paenibacillus sp. WLX2291]|uniref:type III-B CRISPR module RAMP protein Cmr6 n=1 Tax=Paenibacillus sp. WLX2291 TaxID=3296934 RepID=UPI003983E812
MTKQSLSDEINKYMMKEHLNINPDEGTKTSNVSAEFVESPYVSLYSKVYERYYKTIVAGQAAHCFSMSTASNLLLGHGEVSALDSSVELHRMYGVPFIPGTAIKGVAAHYARTVIGSAFPSLLPGGADDVVLFGTPDRAGAITFHDALITPDTIVMRSPLSKTVVSSLKLDVLTPHHQAYNSMTIQQVKQPSSDERSKMPASSLRDTTNNGSKQDLPAPRDDDSPIPVHFFAVQGEFKFMVTCSGEQMQVAQHWLQLAQEIVVGALHHSGIGAKRNAGYGRMKLI